MFTDNSDSSPFFIPQSPPRYFDEAMAEVEYARNASSLHVGLGSKPFLWNDAMRDLPAITRQDVAALTGESDTPVFLDFSNVVPARC